MFHFYNEFSRIFPNYTILEHSKYIYKNIQKKQKVLDNQEEEEEKEAKRKFNLKNIMKIQIIDTENYDSIMKVNVSEDSFINMNIKISKESENEDYSLIELERLISDIENQEAKLKNNNSGKTKTNFKLNLTNVKSFKNLYNEHDSTHINSIFKGIFYIFT